MVSGTSLPLNDVTIARAMSHFFNTSTVTELLTTVYPPNAYNNDDHRAGVILR